MGIAGVEGAGNQRLVGIADLGNTSDGERAEGCSVVGDVAGDDLVAVGLALHAEVLLDELPRGFDSIATAAAEEDAIEIAGSQGCELRRQLNGCGMHEGPERKEMKLVRLLESGVGEFRAAVSDVCQKETGQAVEVSLAVVVEDIAALSTHDEREVVRLAEGCKARPQVPARKLFEFCFGNLLCHFVPHHRFAHAVIARAFRIAGVYRGCAICQPTGRTLGHCGRAAAGQMHLSSEIDSKNGIKKRPTARKPGFDAIRGDLVGRFQDFVVLARPLCFSIRPRCWIQKP